MNTIVIKKQSTFADHAAVARVSRLLAGDEYYSTHDEKGNEVAVIRKSCNTYTVIDKQEQLAFGYKRIDEMPQLLFNVYVTVGGNYYSGRLLGYGDYGKKPNNPDYKIYCVEVIKENGHRFVGFFADIYTKVPVENNT